MAGKGILAQMDELRAALHGLREDNVKIMTKLDGMVLAEAARAEGERERRMVEENKSKDVESRLRKLEKAVTMAQAYAGLASVVVGALIVWLFKLLPT